MWNRCLSNCLFDEIKLIKPELIIFQGKSSFEKLISLLQEKEILTITKKGLREGYGFRIEKKNICLYLYSWR